MGDKKEELHGSILEEDSVDTKEPPLFKVLLHNDDYTTMEFVVSVLENVFNKTIQEATQVMLHVHNDGVGIAGVYTKEICETKMTIVHGLAERNDFPLRCSMEKE